VHMTSSLDRINASQFQKHWVVQVRAIVGHGLFPQKTDFEATTGSN
jgi:hypothetical protein